MAVIAKFVVVRDGVELEPVFTDKKEAEAYDRMLDAAQEMTALIQQGDLKLDIDAPTIDRIAVYLAQNAADVIRILKSVKPVSAEAANAPRSKPKTDAEEKIKAAAPAGKPRQKAV